MMNKSPEQLEHLSRRITLGIALAIFVFMTALGFYQYRERKAFAAKAVPVTLTVVNTETRCRVERKSNKNWHTEGVYACPEAQAIVAQKNGSFTPWRSVEVPYALFAWESSGEMVQDWKAVAQFSSTSLQPGAQVPAIVDPKNPRLIERPFSDDDWTSAVTMSAIGGALGAFVVAIGWWAARWNRKYQERGLAAGGTIGPDGRMVFGAAQAEGTPVVLVTPTWARLVGYGAHAILGLGLLLAVLAAGAGWSSQDATALQGALAIAAISVGLWKALRYLASLGTQPALPHEAPPAGH